MNILKKTENAPACKEREELINELRDVQKLMKQTEMMFHMTVDDDLIEARIYQLKSLAKHQEYLISRLKKSDRLKAENDFVNV